jgi:mevalonate kinase
MNDDINKRLDDINAKLDALMIENSRAHNSLQNMIQGVQKTQGERFNQIDKSLKSISPTISGPVLELIKDSKEDIEHIGKHMGLELPRDLGKSLEKVHASIRGK